MKKLTIKILLVMPLVLSSFTTTANSGGIELRSANVDPSDKQSLQKGAALYVNYCMGCHSASYMRFSRVAKDLGIPEDVMKQNLMFATDKINKNMDVAMRPADAKKWLGVTPPDLSVVARSRGSNWIYTFLDSFYLDDSKSTGVNNLLFKDTAMPHVLWELQGWKKPVMTGGGTIVDDEGHEVATKKHVQELELAIKGSLDQGAYRRTIRDLVNFLTYVAEPGKQDRKNIGFWVIFYLLIFLIPAYKLKKEYWKDVN